MKIRTKTDMNTLYRTHISDKLWLLYDIPGNVGWITYTICAVRAVRKKRDLYNLAAFIPAAFMLVGVSELISERIVGLDRILTGKMLCRGFGSMAAGGLFGIFLALAGLRKGKKHVSALLGGSLLCTVFAGLLLKGYKKEEIQNINI